MDSDLSFLKVISCLSAGEKLPLLKIFISNAVRLFESLGNCLILLHSTIIETKRLWGGTVRICTYHADIACMWRYTEVCSL